MLDLIIDVEGSASLVESKRGTFFRAPSEAAEIIEGVLDAEVTEVDVINTVEADKLTVVGNEIARKLRRVFC